MCVLIYDCHVCVLKLKLFNFKTRDRVYPGGVHNLNSCDHNSNVGVRVCVRDLVRSNFEYTLPPVHTPLHCISLTD